MILISLSSFTSVSSVSSILNPSRILSSSGSELVV